MQQVREGGVGKHPGYGATVAALALGQIIAWAALYYGFTSFVLPMQRALGWGQPVLMGAFTLGLATWGLATYAAGAAIDHGHGRAVMTGGAALGGLGMLAWSQVSAPWMLYAACALMGVAMAMTLYEPAFNVLTKRYPLRYQQGITLLTLVAGFASTLSLPAAVALTHWLDWRGALAFSGAVLLLGVAPLHAWALRGPALVAAPHGHDESDDATLHQALREPSFWLLTLCFTLYSFVIAAIWAHAMPLFESKGQDATQAMAVLVWVGPAQVAGRLLYAGAGRGWSMRVLGAVVLAMLPLSLLLLALGRSHAPLMAFALMFGVANGLVTIVRGALVPLYFGRTHVGRIGGAMSGIGLVARAAAPLAASALLVGLSGYVALTLLMAALAAGATLSFWLARPPR
ncbi:cyanate permease [Burkholderiales bacterium JOSHI_001]|nr:cyanate permease [Burkholderiales bacterium JOSHI_001]